jgi:hypothetical protein
VQNNPTVSLCVEVARVEPTVQRGQAATWLVDAWTEGGNVPDATIRLQSTPAVAQPTFSFGCGTFDGTPSCDLGAMDSGSRPRQLEATVTVPASQSSAQAMTLTVIGSAAYLPRDPQATATMTLTTPSTTTKPTASPVAVGTLSGIPTPGATLSPGGNASGLFPTLQPSGTAGDAKVRKVSDTSALSQSTPVVGAQLAGLAALGLAFVLAVTRLSIRSRPAAGAPGPQASDDSDNSDNSDTSGKSAPEEDRP